MKSNLIQGARLPINMTPYIYTISALMMATIGFYTITREGYAWLIPHQRDRILTGIMLSLLPLGKNYMINNLAYSQWSMLFLLILLLIRRPISGSPLRLVGYIIVVVALIFSQPLSILAIPLCIIQFLFNKGKLERICFAILVAAIVIYQLKCVQKVTNIEFSIENFLLAIKVFFARVIFESIFGAHVTNLLINGESILYIFGISICIICLAFCVAMAGDSPRKRTMILGGAIIYGFAIVYISILIRCTTPDIKINFLREQYFVRYIYVPKLIFAGVIIYQAATIFFTIVRKSKCIRLIFIFSLIFYLAAVNYDNAHLYRDSVEEGRRVREFLLSVQYDLKYKKEGKFYQPVHKLDRGGKWDIIIEIDKR